MGLAHFQVPDEIWDPEAEGIYWQANQQHHDRHKFVPEVQCTQ